MKQEAYPGTQAVLRAMRVLKAVADHGRESRLSDLAREVGLNKTTVFRLLSALESAEMVERTPSGHTYRLGPELVRLSSQALDKSVFKPRPDRRARWPPKRARPSRSKCWSATRCSSWTRRRAVTSSGRCRRSGRGGLPTPPRRAGAPGGAIERRARNAVVGPSCTVHSAHHHGLGGAPARDRART